MNKLESLYENTVKPGRYTGTEFNSRHRDWNKTDLHVAFAFPDTYEIGNSGLGLKILSGILFKDDTNLVERVFSPWIDYEAKLRENGYPLCSLESARPLKDFDVLGFTLPYEMSYTNVLNILDLAKIPFYSKERGEEYPIIIGGGSCAYNPEPIADFFDFFVIGEGEDIITEIAGLIKNHQGTKFELLEKAAEIKGIYVPSFYDVDYDDKGAFLSIHPKKETYPTFIEKCTVNSLDDSYFPVDPPVPFTEIIHDRIMMEISRGCTRGCRFCQAGMIYRPVRERSVETILALTEESVKKTGYGEISLSSLSCTDHNQISRIVSDLQKAYEDSYIEISLPSLRIDSFSVDLANFVQKFRKTTLTLAPEVGTDKMRKIVNKGGSEEEVLETVSAIKKAGWSAVKLYFLTGLPLENDEDIVGIKDLVWKILQKTGLKLTISFSSFVPKAHTPFQWDGFVSIEETKKRQAKLKSLLKHGKITSNFHMPELSFLEAIFAKGDRKLSKVLVEAHKKGCKFDGWNDLFKFNTWMDAFRECNIDPCDYTKPLSLDAPLPWAHLYSKEFHQFLLEERKKALEEEFTADCREICNNCGICGINLKGEFQEKLISTPSQEDEKLEYSDESVQKIRVKYAKKEKARLTSHLDMLRAFQRILRRAQLPVSYTSGFHPRMKLYPGPALALGVISNSEWIDFELRKNIEISDITERMRAASPEGLEILDVMEIPLNAKAVTEITVGAKYRFVPEGADSNLIMEAIAKISKYDSLIVSRKDKSFDVKPFLAGVNFIVNGQFALLIDTVITQNGTIKPSEVILLLEREGVPKYRWGIVKESLAFR